MRPGMKLLLALAMLLTPALAAAAPIRADHPILGTWKFATGIKGCVEIYDYRADGTMRVTSGDEVARSSFTIADKENPGAFYKLVDTVAATNGKPDCSGHVMPLGDVVTLYVNFQNSGTQMSTC